jgi:hypothetical protein
MCACMSTCSIANGTLGKATVQWQQVRLIAVLTCQAFDRLCFADACSPDHLLSHAQVECHPAGPIVPRIMGYRPTAGGFVFMTLGNVAGSGTFTTVDLRTSLQVACSPARWR